MLHHSEPAVTPPRASLLSLLSNIDDRDLFALAHLAGQAETFNAGALPAHADALGRAIQREANQRRRATTVVLSNPTGVSHRVTLTGGPL